MRRIAVLLLALLPLACHRAPPANPHYVLGDPYQAGDAWFYPHDSFDAVETGLATIYPSGHADLTTDGETFDQNALAAAHATLQLPAIARLTDLDTGRQVLVRVNDRGSPTPHRLLQVTRRTAALLGFPPDGVARVRLEILPAESHDAVDAAPGAPRLAMQAAPRDAVQQTDLPPPGSTAQTGSTAASPAPAQSQPSAPAASLVLPETVTQTTPAPGQLYVRLGTFQGYQYAAIQRARLGGIRADIVSKANGRAQTFSVIVGPLASLQEADTMLDQVLRSGVTDARIVVE